MFSFSNQSQTDIHSILLNATIRINLDLHYYEIEVSSIAGSSDITHSASTNTNSTIAK